MTTPTTHKEQYFATVNDGTIAVLTEGFPPQELVGCQIELSAEEYHLLKCMRGDFSKTKRLIKAIAAKIKANGS